MSKHMRTIFEIDPERGTARVEPGIVHDQLTNSRNEVPPHVRAGYLHAQLRTLGGMLGNNSCGVHSVMAGRTSDNISRARGLDLRRSAHAGRRDIGRGARAHHRGRRPAGEIYAGCATCATATPTRSGSAFPKIPRRVSGYNLDELLPENGFNVARALVGTEGTLRHGAGGHAAARPQPAEPDAAGARLPGRLQRRRPRAGDHGVRARSAWRGSTTAWRGHERRGHCTARISTAARRASGWLLVEFGGETNEEADDRARELHGRAAAGEATPPAMKLYRRPGRGAEDLGGARGGPGRHRLCSRRARPPGRAGRTRPSRRSSVGDYLRDFRKLLDRYGYQRRSTAISARAASTAASTSTCVTPAACEHCRAFMDEAADLVVALRRLAVRRTRRRPGAGRAAAQDVRAGADARRSGSSRRSGTRTGR